MGQMIRHCVHQTVALTASAASTPAISIADFASGEVVIPAASALTTLTFYVASHSGGTYTPAYDSSGNAVTLTVVSSRAYPLPVAVFGAAMIKMVGNDVGSVDVTLKS